MKSTTDIVVEEKVSYPCLMKMVRQPVVLFMRFSDAGFVVHTKTVDYPLGKLVDVMETEVKFFNGEVVLKN